MVKWVNDSIYHFQASAAVATVKGLRGCKTLNKDPDPFSPTEGKEDRYILFYSFFSTSHVQIRCINKLLI